MASIKILSTIVVFLALALFWCWAAFSDASIRTMIGLPRWAATIVALVVSLLSVFITADLLVIIWSM